MIGEMTFVDEEEPYCDECGEMEHFALIQSDASKDWYKCRCCGNDQITVFRVDE